MTASGDEIAQLRAVVQDFLRSNLPMSAVRTAGEKGTFDTRAWRSLSDSLGLTGIGIPEELGGAGHSFRELGVVLEEFGAALAPVPLLSSAVAAAAVLAGDEGEPRAALLPGLAGGRTIAAPWFGAGLVVTGEGLVHGRAGHVPDGAHADVFVLAATDPGSPDDEMLLVVDADTSGVSVQALNALDPTRPIAAVRFDGAASTVLGRGAALMERARTVQQAAVACEQVGGAARCLEMIVDYAKTRHQFGAPIGSFQAVKHRCADMLVELEAARSIAYHLRDSLADGDGEPGSAAAAAAWCSETYVHIAQETIQLHGGIGFTWEHDAHLHVRRARSDQLLYGTPRDHRRTLADLMGL